MVEISLLIDKFSFGPKFKFLANRPLDDAWLMDICFTTTRTFSDSRF